MEVLIRYEEVCGKGWGRTECKYEIPAFTKNRTLGFLRKL